MSMIFPPKPPQIQAKTPWKINLGQVLDSVNHKNQLTAVVASLETKFQYKDTKELYRPFRY